MGCGEAAADGGGVGAAAGNRCARQYPLHLHPPHRRLLLRFQVAVIGVVRSCRLADLGDQGALAETLWDGATYPADFFYLF
ncbi:hypothetical protein BRADI_3g27753v3 [Brachypodium distachyon]|uniref:Uncharacterized protein n=1 Tax=Brachypodium distachyon TaxID=15368 RepID=A0A2K2CZL8_BRADI|nr:hypothetical protein BRADI_3g27753v3 [Brachypodium distachyon]